MKMGSSLQICLIHHERSLPVYGSSPDNAEDTLSTEVSDFADVFSKIEADVPPYRDFDCTIDLQPGALPPTGKVYNLTVEEDTVLKDNIDKGFIRKSVSPFGAPCFFVKKPDWTGDKNFVYVWIIVASIE